MARQVWQWVMLTLVAYRITRLIAADSLPLVKVPRQRAEAAIRRRARNQDWAAGFECPWCVGVWVCAGTFALAMWWMPIRYPFAQAIAAMAVVGLIAENWDHW